MRRQKYFDVEIGYGQDNTHEPVSWIGMFDCIRDAAEWFVEEGRSKSIPAARVGMSTVLTGKRDHYRGLKIKAGRFY